MPGVTPGAKVDTAAADTRSVDVERTRLIAAGGPVVGAHFLKSTAVFVLGEEALLFAADGEPQHVAAHGGAILAAASDGERIVTGGDDGKVMATRADMTTAVIAANPKRRWIDHVAIGPEGAVAWSAGKDAFVKAVKGEERQVEVPSTVGGLAFAPKGLRLAIAHYHGVTLWFPNAAAPPERLEWKGSHLGVTFSPDGRFLVTAMREPALHGWRLADRNHMRMSGYSARVRSMSWSADGHALATSGANELVVWPFHGKDGPMGKEPRTLAPAAERVAIAACHPKKEVAAAGYADGMVLLVRMQDGRELLARRGGGASISALAWNADGTALAFGTEDGEAGVIDLS
jgi:WD40 repeat protein